MPEEEKSEEKSLYASCMAACPVKTDTRKYVELITQGRYNEALDLLLEANPFSSVCGRICHHPCEDRCRRASIDAPVGLKKLKRFIIESTKDYRNSRRKPLSPPKKERVAIVGSGPSGLTAAHDLAMEGYRVTVFERDASAGGMLGAAIPRYRLPLQALEEDVDDIRRMGVKIVLGCEIGKDKTIQGLFDEGFRSVLIATGLSESRGLGIPGIDCEGVLLGVPFLRSLFSGSPPPLGSKVVVIGGGNVAVDVARSARRLGAKKVHLVSLESREEMPAWKEEIEEALEEGIEISNSWGPKSIFAEDGKVRGIELKKCTCVFDGEGRFNPAFDETDVSTLVADNVIISIGQYADLACLEGSGLARQEGNRLVFDPETLATSQKGVFACGEVVTGPGAAVEAVSDGHRAAQAIAHYLQTGELIKQPPRELPSLGDIPSEVIEKIKKRTPVKTVAADPEERVKDFSEIERGFTEAEAHAEASRCLSCLTGAFVDEEKCAGCLTCVRICPFGVATVEKTAVMPEEKCQACGLCAAECPAAAIALKRFGTRQMREQLAQLLREVRKEERPSPLLVSYCCLFEATSRVYLLEESHDFLKTGIVRITLPCVGRLSVVDILAPFEHGTDGVVIISCSEGKCLYPSVEERLASRIREARKVLEEIGFEKERIDHWKTQGSAEVSWSSFWSISRKKIAAL